MLVPVALPEYVSSCFVRLLWVIRPPATGHALPLRVAYGISIRRLHHTLHLALMQKIKSARLICPFAQNALLSTDKRRFIIDIRRLNLE